jgi:hypothetical protein
MPPLSRSLAPQAFRRPLRVGCAQMHAGQMHAVRHALLVLLACALVVGGAPGCGPQQATPDSKIVTALGLKQGGHAYQIGGDPFCTVDELLNDADEVKQASDKPGHDFLIASPNGEIGVLARRPFAPDCARRAKDALKRLAKKAD